MNDRRYERRRLLGRGGFGEVWLAYDRQLRRDVAIKSITSTQPEDRARFEREARLAAALQHPNIVPVHDIGDGFLVMEFIDGVPADRSRPSPRDAAEIVRQAADAVAHAHARGIVHRDLKPANILVAGTRAFVTDFGLAKQVGVASSLSMTGDVFGTPSFMSPEQALGNVSEIGPRSDVFSLGSTLYALLAGVAPFTGDDALTVVRKVVDAEPPPLPETIDRDLRVIVGRAMEKLPARRYASAADLSADLGRYLAGEPILARPATVLYRLRRRVRRNPWAWRLGAAAVAVASVSAAWLLFQVRDNRRRAEVQRLQREAESLHAAALTAALAGDPDGDAMMREFEARLDAARALDPAIGEPWFHRARYARLSGDEDVAWKRVSTGLAADPGDPMGRLEHGMLLLGRHRREFRFAFDEAQENERREALIQGRPVRAIDAAEVERRNPELARRKREALDEISAVASADSTERRKPWVKLALADLERINGNYEAAIDLVRDLGYAAAKVTLGRIAEGTGDDATAEDYYRMAMNIQPTHWDAYESYAYLKHRPALAGSNRGTPASIDMAASVVEIVTRFLARRPGHERAILSRAFSLNLQGSFEYLCGRDPTASHEAALADAGPLAERHESAAGAVGSALWGIGLWKAEHGEDPAAEFQRAVESLEEACRRFPDTRRLLQHLGQTRIQVAAQQAARGADAEPSFRRAVEDLERALLLRPHDSEGRIALGSAWLWRAQWLQRIGADPTETSRRAQAHYDAALAIDLQNDGARCNRAVASILIGDQLLSRGADPTAAYREAIAGQDDVLSRRPSDAWPLVGKGNALMGIGRWELLQGVDPSESLRASVDCYDAALLAYPRDAATLNNRGNSLMLWGKHERGARRDPTALLRRAVESFDAALEIQEADAAVHANRGLALENLGDWELFNARDPVKAYEDAIRAYDRALAIDRTFLPAWNNRGNSYAQWARWLAATDADPDEQVRLAFESFDGAIAANEAYWEAHVNKGLLLEDLGRTAEALASYETALRHNPDHPTIRELVERLR